MTGLLPEKEFSRKTLLKGGALIVGVSTVGFGVAGKASAAVAPSPAGYNPDQAQADTYLTVNSDNTVTVTFGSPDWGHGLYTGVLMMVGEELDLDLSQMNYARPDTWINGTGGGGGSNGFSSRALGVRAAAVAARQALFSMASTQLGVPVASLTTSKGVITGGGKSVKFGDLMGGKLFKIALNPATLQPGVAPAKPVSSYKLIGTAPGRVDIPAKVNATYTYVHNVRIPGMLHARVVRPHGQGGVTSQDHFPISVDPNSVSHIPGAKVVQVGAFIAVTAPKEYDAIQAAAQLKVVWKSDPKLSGSGNFYTWLRTAGDTNTVSPARYTTNVGNVDAALKSSAKTVAATYKFAYNGHLSIGPTCALADVHATGMTIFCNSQQISTVPTTIAGFQLNGQSYFNMQPQNIRCFYYEGSSSYGSMLSTGPCTDVYIAAAVISKNVGAPVRLQWMRWDEHGWDAYGPAAMYDVKAGIDAAGNITALDWTAYGQGGTSLMPTSEQVGFATWPAVPASGGPASADSPYKVAVTNKRLLAKTQPLYAGGLKSAALRAPGAPQSHFAGEQLIDELAYAANMDPVAFRKQNVDPAQTGTVGPVGQRWLAALNGAAILSSWQPKVANSVKQTGNVRKGRGIGFGTFGNSQVATVADVSVNIKTGKITVNHLYVAHNNGITGSPDLIANQAEGASIMGLSRTMQEQLVFSKERVTSVDWVTYPILRFADAPHVTVGIVTPTGVVMNKPGGGTNVLDGNSQAYSAGWINTGSGEPAMAAVPAAVANALFDATGARLREAPMTPARVRGALAAAGVK
ncbi:MAG TPA: molybdopterin cofactor-binding domain-containing protein [Gaiellaceae bacterium]|jgi:CO/xanthine dehydrogenase Mo-binding subunit|nr:molybdopterin cofactor-binding domain-containing protein [Gaiellaceae bacterium]